MPADTLPPPPAGYAVESSPANLPPPPPGYSIEGSPHSFLDSAQHAISNWWDQVNPAKQAQGVVHTLAHPIEAVKAYGASNGELASKAHEAFKKGEYSEGIRHSLSYLLNGLPGVGSTIDHAGNQVASGDLSGGLGTAAGLATNLGVAAKAPALADRAATAIANTGPPAARSFMQSALKPGVADAPTLADARAVSQTAVERAIPVNEAGVTKLNGLLADYGQKVKALVDQGKQAGQTVSRDAVAARIDQDLRPTLRSQVNPTKDLATAEKSKMEFIDTQPPDIPINVAQTLKTGTYQQIRAKYGEMGNATVEAQKTLARGLKEEIEAKIPELKGLNAEEGKLLDLQPALERAVRRLDNSDLVKLGETALTGGGAVVAGPAGAGTGFVLGKILSSGYLKSRLAIAINKASRNTKAPLDMGASMMRAGAVLNSLAQTEQPQNQ